MMHTAVERNVKDEDKEKALRNDGNLLNQVSVCINGGMDPRRG